METYGACVAAFQAERALPELRPLMRRIAGDEARHPELAHDVARWIDALLTPEERARAARARARARDEVVAALGASIDVEPDPEVARVAGLPRPLEAKALLDGLAREIPAAA